MNLVQGAMYFRACSRQDRVQQDRTRRRNRPKQILPSVLAILSFPAIPVPPALPREGVCWLLAAAG